MTQAAYWLTLNATQEECSKSQESGRGNSAKGREFNIHLRSLDALFDRDCRSDLWLHMSWRGDMCSNKGKFASHPGGGSEGIMGR